MSKLNTLQNVVGKAGKLDMRAVQAEYLSKVGGKQMTRKPAGIRGQSIIRKGAKLEHKADIAVARYDHGGVQTLSGDVYEYVKQGPNGLLFF